MAGCRKQIRDEFKMLKAIVTDLEGVNESYRDLYKDNGNGAFVLNVEPVDGFALENVNGLKTALSSERSASQEYKGKLSAYEGIDAAAARDALAKIEKFKGLDPEVHADKIAEERVNLIKGQIQSEFEEKSTAITQENEQLRNALLGQSFQSEAIKAIADNDGNATLLMPILKNMIKTDFVDGKVQVHVIGEDGKPRIKDHVNNVPFSVSDLVAELRTNEAYGGAFKAQGGGTGVPAHKTATPPAAKADIGGSIQQRRAALEALLPDLKKR